MEKQFKGTPGEWKQSHRQIPNDEDGMYSTQVYTEYGETIATLAWYAKPPVIENDKKITGSYRTENAKLIAAAPSLLEALQDCVNTIEWLVENGNVNQNLLETFCNISTNSLELSNEAINKALD